MCFSHSAFRKIPWTRSPSPGASNSHTPSMMQRFHRPVYDHHVVFPRISLPLADHKSVNINRYLTYLGRSYKIGVRMRGNFKDFERQF